MTSKDEENVLAVAKEGLGGWPGGGTGALHEWFIGALRAYIVAGYRQGAIVDRIPQLLEVFVEHLRHTQETFQDAAADLNFTAAERKEDEEGARAAEALIERVGGKR